MRKVIPVILTNDVKDLKDKLEKLDNLTDWVQIDIMDGKFVSNTSIRLKDLKKIQSNFNLEAHLMVLNPEKYLRISKKVNIKRIIFHFETVKYVLKILKKIEKLGFEKGIALNPETSIEKIEPYLDRVDLILLLGVQPGFGGQKFNPLVIDKIKSIKKIEPGVKIEVDGGINLSNISDIAKAGADYLVVGAGLFSSSDVRQRFIQLQEKVK